MSLRPYLVITRNSVMASLAYRAHFFFTMLGTLIYLVVTYFLWRAIYSGKELIGGLSFAQAFMTVGVSTAIFGVLLNWVEWFMYYTIREGDLIRFLCKPIDYRLQLLADVSGGAIMNAAIIALPAIIASYLLSGSPAPGPLRIILFAASLGLGFLLNFAIDFSVGLMAFAIQTVWGVSTAKEVVVLFLSGAVVPLAFFPASVRGVLEWLPFQAIYYAPIRILVDTKLDFGDISLSFAKQAAWLAALTLLSRFFFSRLLKKVVINGG